MSICENVRPWMLPPIPYGIAAEPGAFPVAWFGAGYLHYHHSTHLAWNLHGPSKATHSPWCCVIPFGLAVDHAGSSGPFEEGGESLHHPSPAFCPPQRWSSCSCGRVCHQACLLFAGGFSETYAALCDYNGFAFREEIQWVSWSVPWRRYNGSVPLGRQGSKMLTGLVGLGTCRGHPGDQGHPRAWNCSFAWLECPLLLGGVESKCR